MAKTCGRSLSCGSVGTPGVLMVRLTTLPHRRRRRRSLARLTPAGGGHPSRTGVPLWPGMLAAVGFGVSGEVRAVILVVGDAIAVAVGGCGVGRRIAALPGVRLLSRDLQVGRAVFQAGLDLRAFVPYVKCVGCCSYWLPPTRCRQAPITTRHGEHGGASSRQPACHERHSHRSGTQHSLGVMQTPDPTRADRIGLNRR